MSFSIRGIGTAIPEYFISQQDAAEFAKAFCPQTEEHLRLLPALYRRTGVKRRHCVILQSKVPEASSLVGSVYSHTADKNSATVDQLTTEKVSTARQSFYRAASELNECGPTTGQRMQLYEKFAGDLAIQAAKTALDNSEIPASQITHLITVSCTGFSAPGVDLEIIQALGLPANTARTHVGFMGCHGALNALRLAHAFAEAEPNACVLIAAVELCSLHHQYGWHPERVVANALFADGAAAIVGTSKNEGETDSSWQLLGNRSTVLEHSREMMSWSVRDHGFEMTLSSGVPDIIRETLGPWLETWLTEYNLSVQEIGSWAVHPGGPRILNACAEAAGFDPELLRPSRQILADYGNMSSPTVLFILEQLMRDHATRPCVMLAFGPGLSVEAALVT